MVILLSLNLVKVWRPKKELVVEKQKVRVIKVIDGDTIEIDTGQRVRYLGVDTPEMNFYGKKAECFAHEATKRNKELVGDKEIEIEKVISETDEFGRILRFVYVDGVSVSEILLKEGMGREQSIAPDVKYVEDLARAEQEARENRRGLWGGCE